MGDDEPEAEFEDIEEAFDELEGEAESEADEDVELEVGAARNVIEVEADDVEVEGKQVITGGEFECELELDRETTASFLRDLAHQVETGTSLTVGGDGWEVPFEYAEPIEVEIEHEGREDEEPRELEIEIEFEWGGASDHLEVR